jgi:hypothetical protein
MFCELMLRGIGAQVLLLSWPCTTIDLDAPHPISPDNVL